MSLRAVVVPCVLMLSLASRSGAAVAPVITFEQKAAVVSGVTPGGKVVWFSVAREIAQHTATIVPRQQLVEDTTKLGTVRFELERDVPFQSIWVAVDLTTGAAALGVPDGYPLRQFQVSPGHLRHTEGKPDWITETRSYVEILLVRPEQGAWWTTVGDGGSADDDGIYDGHVVASLPKLDEVDGSIGKAPETFAAKDVVVILDPNRMEVGFAALREVPK